MKRKHLFSAITFFVFCSFIAKAQQQPGYTLYSVKNTSSSTLLDTNGAVYHTWTHASTDKTGYSTYLMPGGILWRTVAKTGNSFTGGPICGQVQKVAYDGTVLWNYIYSTTTYCSHHDICPMPNGNVLLIAYESKTAAEVAAAGCSTFSNIMWPDKIVEIQPTGATTGTVVWEWHAWDHLVQNTNASAANYQTSIVNHPELLNINYQAQKDWLHVNGVNYNPMLDQIAISSHNLHEIYVIDHSTTTAEAASHAGGNSGKGGDILYRWGNPLAYGATGTKIFNVVHDAHWIPEGTPNAGFLVGYNNQGISTTQSCVDGFNPPVNGYNYDLTLGSAYTPSTYGFRQASGGYNSNEGGSQQLPNGNMLVCMGISGFIKEFSPTGTLLWSQTLTGGCAKAFRHSACYINNAAPPIPTVTETAGDLSSSSATTYQWYLNGVQISGATSQSYTPTQDGIYLVRTTDVNGCVYEYSLGYEFTMPVGLKDLTIDNDAVVYPNPTNGVVNIKTAGFVKGDFTIVIYDTFGKILKQVKNQASIDMSELHNGIYYLSIFSEEAGRINKKVTLVK